LLQTTLDDVTALSGKTVLLFRRRVPESEAVDKRRSGLSSCLRWESGNHEERKDQREEAVHR
jgi:hypothetical protein